MRIKRPICGVFLSIPLNQICSLLKTRSTISLQCDFYVNNSMETYQRIYINEVRNMMHCPWPSLSGTQTWHILVAKHSLSTIVNIKSNIGLCASNQPETRGLSGVIATLGQSLILNKAKNPIMHRNGNICVNRYVFNHSLAYVGRFQLHVSVYVFPG